MDTLDPAPKSDKHWIDRHCKESLVSMVLADRFRRLPQKAKRRPRLPSAIYVHHIAPFLRFDEPVDLLYAVGGRLCEPLHPGSAKFASAEVYDSWSNRWKRLPDMSRKRAGVPACAFGKHGGILVAGGYERVPEDPMACVEAFCPLRNSWTRLAPMMQARYGHALVQGTHGIYAIGGSSGTTVCSTVEKYDIEEDIWSRCADVPETLSGGRGIEVKGYILYIGGFVSDERLSNRIYIYDPGEDSWRVSRVHLRHGRTAFAAVENKERNTLMLTGGQTAIDGDHFMLGSIFAAAVNSEELNIDDILNERRDSVDYQSTDLPSLPMPRTGCQGAFLEKYGFVVVGGEDGIRESEWSDFASVALTRGVWRDILPQPTVPRVAFGMALTRGRPVAVDEVF